ncbi:MAG: type IV toxin-antitoxin system AbiEi family antitoxin domain-containing protein [Candidatus Micrarchaeota archaeon]
MKYLKDVRERFGASAAFTIGELQVFLGKRGISRGYLRLLIHNLLAKGEIKRISRGVYTFCDDVQVVGFGFRPFYYGLQEALSLMNLWSQETNPVVITPRKVRSGVRAFDGANYLVKRINREMFFGFKMMRYQKFWIPVSDVEKTLIDFVYFKEPLNQEAIGEIRKNANEKILRGYLKRCSGGVRKRVRKLVE